jgi:hypothetical protein
MGRRGLWEDHSSEVTSRWHSRGRGFNATFEIRSPEILECHGRHETQNLPGGQTSAAPLVGPLSKADLLSASVRRNGRRWPQATLASTSKGCELVSALSRHLVRREVGRGDCALSMRYPRRHPVIWHGLRAVDSF